MAIGPVGQRPLPNPVAPDGPVQPSADRLGIQAGHSQLSQASSNGDSNPCVNVPVIGWIFSGIISCYSWFVKFVLSCCTRSQNPPLPPAPPVNGSPNEARAVNANPNPIPAAAANPNSDPERPRPVRPSPSSPVQGHERAERPAPAPAPAPQLRSLLERFQNCMSGLAALRRNEGRPERLALEPVPVDPLGGRAIPE